MPFTSKCFCEETPCDLDDAINGYLSAAASGATTINQLDSYYDGSMHVVLLVWE